MSKKLSYLISWGSMATIALMLIVLFSFLIDIAWFAELAQSNLRLPIYWTTVEQWQWYLLWASTAVYLAIGLFGLYFLHLAFRKIATGELFNLANSLNIRRFSILLLVQALAKPICFSGASVLLSLNHPEGEKVFSLFFGSQELTLIALAMIFWVVSDLLVAGSRLQSENRQFI
ncbi:MAG: hypothetical protein ACRBHB_23110 [Arenicella sp.]